VSFNTVLPSDVHALKVRVSPSVDLVRARVNRALSLPSELRAQWQAFASEWSEYVRDNASTFSPSNYDTGLALEGKLRDLKSVLSSQCPGVSPPSAKRPSPFFGTWASPTDVRAQKNRTDALVRALNSAMAASSSLDADARRAWSEFFRGWVSFFNDDDSWVHGATLYECAVAYEDTLPEWRDVLDFASRDALGASPAAPNPFPLPLTSFAPAPAARPESGPGVAAAVIAVASVLALGIAFSQGTRR
jgi:hypothetical protein